MKYLKKEKSKVVKLLLCLLPIILILPKTALSEWKIWVVPESRSVDVGNSLKFVFGISGGGYLKPENVKVLIYSETDSLLKSEKDEGWRNDIYAVLLNSNTPVDVFQKLDTKIPEGTPNILFESEHTSPFGPIHVKPQSSGDKKITIILSYKDNDNKWRAISEEFSYHAKGIVEQYEQIGFILATLLALIGIWKDFLFIPIKKIYNKNPIGSSSKKL